MRYFKRLFLLVFISALSCLPAKAEMTIEKLFFDNSQPFHLKILKVIPDEGIIQIGDDNAKNTIIEFMDYFCGYCKKIHPELIELAERRDDTRVVFLQHPILSQSSEVIAAMVVAANIQGKGNDFHNALFEIPGSLTQEKLNQIISDLEINRNKLMIDIGKDEIKNVVKLSSFVAMGSGARGTPALFINEEFLGGYVPVNQFEKFLR